MADEPVTLKFLARQQQRLIEEMRTEFRSAREEMASFRDDMRVLTAMVMRLDGTVGLVVAELRAMHSQHQRLANRVRRFEERVEEPE
jgi:chromosome segregation ATPase